MKEQHPLDAITVEPAKAADASIIWLHGLGADGHDFEPIIPELRLPESAAIRFIFPNAPIRAVTINGGLSMRAWYDIRQIDLTRQEDAESIQSSSEHLNRFVEQEIEKGIEASRIILAGFSQGGAIALYNGLRQSRSLAGILALSTYLPLPDSLGSEISAANRTTPILQMHGNFDPVIPLQTAKNTLNLLKQNDLNVSWQEYAMQHSVCPQQITDIADWIKLRLAV